MYHVWWKNSVYTGNFHVCGNMNNVHGTVKNFNVQGTISLENEETERAAMNWETFENFFSKSMFNFYFSGNPEFSGNWKSKQSTLVRFFGIFKSMNISFILWPFKAKMVSKWSWDHVVSDFLGFYRLSGLWGKISKICIMYTEHVCCTMNMFAEPSTWKFYVVKMSTVRWKNRGYHQRPVFLLYSP